MLENTNFSLGVIEALFDLSHDLDDLHSNITNPIQKELALNIKTKLDTLLQLLDNKSSPIVLDDSLVRENAANFNSIVYKLGIQGELLKMRQRGYTIAKMAEQLGVAANVISRFFRYYDHLSNLEKLKVRQSSVMNTPERLEELFNMILRRLHMLEGINDELHVQYVKELRQTLALASQVADKMVNYKEYQRFTEAVWELLKLELPDKRRLITEKIALLQQSRSDVAKSLMAQQ
jgi:hypothetical protein